jgi:hypothetical protein
MFMFMYVCLFGSALLDKYKAESKSFIRIESVNTPTDTEDDAATASMPCVCKSLLATYLTQFNLQALVADVNVDTGQMEVDGGVDARPELSEWSAGGTMKLNGAALTSLGVVTHDGGLSLVNFLDNCSTASGSRLLAQWVTRPLLSVPAIQVRGGVCICVYV